MNSDLSCCSPPWNHSADYYGYVTKFVHVSAACKLRHGEDAEVCLKVSVNELSSFSPSLSHSSHTQSGGCTSMP